jgi:hypothetical protein
MADGDRQTSAWEVTCLHHRPFRLDAIIGTAVDPSIPPATDAILTPPEIGIRRGTVGATLSQALRQRRRGGSHVV